MNLTQETWLTKERENKPKKNNKATKESILQKTAITKEDVYQRRQLPKTVVTKEDNYKRQWLRKKIITKEKQLQKTVLAKEDAAKEKITWNV